MRQMINHLVVHYTSKSNSQDSPQHNGVDQNLLKTRSMTSPLATSTPTAAASTQNPVHSKLLMEDQDAPLDLSVKKVKPEVSDQDVVLDLSLKKSHNADSMCLRSPHVNLTTPVVRRTASDSALAKGRDLPPSAALEQFMAKLCLHHQRQIVDAFGFLQNEVKAVTSSGEVQESSSANTENPISSESTVEGSENQNQDVDETLLIARVADGGQTVSNNEFSPSEQPLGTDGPLIASIKNGSSADIGRTDIEVNDCDDENVECTDIQPKCPSLMIVKNDPGSFEAKKLSGVGLIIQQPNTDSLEQDPRASGMQSHTNSTDNDTGAMSSCSTSNGPADPKCLSVCSSDAPAKPCSIQRTTNAISRTAKKSSKSSRSRSRLGPIGNIVNDPDSKYDIVYVGKPITECKLQSQNHMLPRKNARKSTRGHLSVGDCWEIKTVRTLSRKSAQNASGNYPVPMPEFTTPKQGSITPKQDLAKPDGLPAMTVPFTGDCMETLKNKNLSDQSVVTEIPGDVVEISSEDLIVEPSQTGQTQNSKDSTSSLLDDEVYVPLVQRDCLSIHDLSDSSEEPPITIANKTIKRIEFTTEETITVPASSVVLDGLEAEVKGENVATETLLNSVSSCKENDAPPTVDSRAGSDLKSHNAANGDLTKSPEQTNVLGTQVMTCTGNSTMLEMTCGTEANIKAVDSMNPDKDEGEVKMSDLVVEETTPKEELEGCKEGVSESVVIKKGVAKHTTPSDRCLRSGVSKGISEQTTISGQTKPTNLESDNCEKKVPKSNQSFMSVSTGEDVSCQGGQNKADVTDSEKAQQSTVITQIDSIGNKVCTRQKQKLLMVKEMECDKEQIEERSNPNDELKAQDCVVNDVPKIEVNPPPLESCPSPEINSPGKSIKVSERMPLRSRDSQSEHSVSNDACSPTRNIPHTPERMPLRSRCVDHPVDGDSCTSPTTGTEKSGRMPLRNRNSGLAEQTVGKDSCIPNASSLDCAPRMPLRSRNSSAVSRPVSEGSSDVNKDTSGPTTEQPSVEDSGVASKKLANTGHMPLRSGSLIAEQTSNFSSSGSDPGTVSESPGRMSLRRNNTFSAEKQDCLATPPKIKKLSQRQKMCRTSVLSLVTKGAQINNHAISNTGEPCDQMNVSSMSNSFTSFNLPTSSPLIPTPCRFLEALNGEANQHLISDLNNKFDKMQKGWVQMDKEGPPAPKPKNKADRLKEIWKSKRRIRKPRSLEQHKLSPVQMLFMKSFDLQNICRWFLQSTETKSLVIVKKVNTRLPSETHLRFQTSTSVPGSSDGVFPSLQAERLKKHLKKFAIASPVKSNPKNKRLIAKALAHGMSKGKEKQELRTATRISSKPQSSGLKQAQSLESHSKVAASAKNLTSARNPASARILRKYSNMREKKQVHQNTLKNLKRSLEDVGNSQSMTKVSKEKLSKRRGQKSAIVKKQLVRNTKTPTKAKIPKGGARGLSKINEKDRLSRKRVLPRVLKSTRVTTPKTVSKKEMVKPEKSPQAKTDKKSPLHKGCESLLSSSQIMDMKPLLSEDQVLTRSQRKMEATLAQTGSPKNSTKRGMETLVTLAKRTRTSK
ncbi:uncharacterized protein wu:fc17b08 isoform X2 [Silurus meridionalis]|nr:uncharacterized protein wu:fc17b08 isoform X2 [Silurus meridionalis]